ncbi:GNAT family N-acetyltransferase [Arthrobacter globiformis]|uniref:GNAT family N-acetyltransferase n=1 Tax=Arthrobacter globiformis TaxID=1665 RepID=UPI0027D8564A|nr:GNAT family N-acetyltransferase [Arthrobacter globiformis]
MAPSFRIEPLILPSSTQSPEATDFLEFSELSDALILETWGNLDLAAPREARLESWRDDDYKQARFYFVRVNGRMVARSSIGLPLAENLDVAMVRVDVLNEFTGRGIGQMLLRHAEEFAARHGRTTVQSSTEHAAGFDPHGPGILKPGTGTGGVPADSRAVKFALAAGYALEQVTQFSALDLPVPDGTLDALEQKACSIAGNCYDLLTWTDRCPDDYVDEMAVLMSRMSTDSPSGELHFESQVWDAKRVRHVEDEWKQSGMESLVSVARHKPSGELAAYSVLQYSASKPWLAVQDDTLVARAHRGSRLGMLVKILNLRRLEAERPSVERILTFNAAENGHMLAINVVLGFRPAGYSGEWQRRR